MMDIGRLASEVGKGIFAGVAGTALMTISSTVEAKLRDREPSSAPADAASRVLGVKPEGEAEKQRFSNLAHWGYGTGWGVARGIIGWLGLGPVVGTAAHFAAVWGTEMLMLPALEIAPPLTEWGPKEVAVDGLHHGVYALGAGLTYVFLDRRGSVELCRR